MSKIFTLITVSILCTNLIFAQAPQALNYQAVARNVAGAIIPNQTVSVRFSLRDGSPTGTVVYSETHTTSTNQFGLFMASIGAGNIVSGNFTTINWATGNKYLQTELDPTGGTSFVSMGTSVPIPTRWRTPSDRS